MCLSVCVPVSSILCRRPDRQTELKMEMEMEMFFHSIPSTAAAPRTKAATGDLNPSRRQLTSQVVANQQVEGGKENKFLRLRATSIPDQTVPFPFRPRLWTSTSSSSSSLPPPDSHHLHKRSNDPPQHHYKSTGQLSILCLLRLYL